ncbi:VWA domain-containing protein [Azospirillum argentinense]
MADTRITTTDSSGTRRLGLHGQLAVSMHRQLATILGNRLGAQHARYFARPALTPNGGPNGGRIDWYAPLAGTARPLTALPAADAERLAAQARQIESDIAQLAAKLKAEGQSAELVGRMLELALVTPGPSRGHLYEVGGQPVLTQWGHEAEGAAGLSDATAPSGTPSGIPSGAPSIDAPSIAEATGGRSAPPDSSAAPADAGTRITSTGPSGTRRLELDGQPAVSMHRPLATILGNRLGPRHARYLARPVLGPNGGPSGGPSGGRIDWHAPLAGTVRPLTALPAADAERLAAQARQIESDIAQLAAKLKAEGQPDERMGRMLEQALVTPGPSRGHLYEVGGQPVLTQWGHEAEGASKPGAAGAPPFTTGATSGTRSGAAIGGTAEAGALGATAGVSAPRTLRDWLAWLLPLLLALLLLFLLLRACEPLPPVTVEVPGAAPAAPAGNGDALAALESEEQILRAKLAELNRNRAEDLAQCGPVPPAIQPVEPVPPALPPRAELPPPAAPAPATPAPTKPEAAPPAPEAAPPPKPKPKAQAAQTPPAEPKPKSCNPTFAPGDEPEVVLIVDGSKSMDERHLGPQTRMDLARRSIEHMVRGLPKPVEVALVEFTTCTDVRRDKFYSAPERDALVREVQRLTPTGGTPLARSLERAGNIVSSDADATIVVVSDGDDTCHGDPCAVARAIKDRKPRVTINVIDLSDQSGRATVQCIAKATGGKVLSPSSGADMLQKMQQATRQPDVRQCGP